METAALTNRWYINLPATGWDDQAWKGDDDLKGTHSTAGNIVIKADTIKITVTTTVSNADQ